MHAPLTPAVLENIGPIWNNWLYLFFSSYTVIGGVPLDVSVWFSFYLLLVNTLIWSNVLITGFYCFTVFDPSEMCHVFKVFVSSPLFSFIFATTGTYLPPPKTPLFDRRTRIHICWLSKSYLYCLIEIWKRSREVYVYVFFLAFKFVYCFKIFLSFFLSFKISEFITTLWQTTNTPLTIGNRLGSSDAINYLDYISLLLFV